MSLGRFFVKLPIHRVMIQGHVNAQDIVRSGLGNSTIFFIYLAILHRRHQIFPAIVSHAQSIIPGKGTNLVLLDKYLIALLQSETQRDHDTNISHQKSQRR
jgi:hypothetical protein